MKRFIAYLILFSVVLVAVIEIVFRYVVPASEFPYSMWQSDYSILLYDRELDEEGQYTMGRLAQERFTWKINNEGWNSSRDFLPPEERSIPLVAFVGSSYVQAFQVDCDRNMTVQIEELLEHEVDVYGFGMGGALFPQYPSISQYVEDKFDPDMYVFFVSDGNLESALARNRSRLNRQLVVTDRGIREVAAETYAPGMSRMLRSSSFARYIIGNCNVDFDLKPRNFQEANRAAQGQAREEKEDREELEMVASYILHLLRDQHPDKELVFLVDAPRRLIYAGDRSDDPLLESKILSGLVDEIDGYVIDMNAAFREAWETDGKRFNSTRNFHWNEYSHRLASREVVRYLKTNGLVPDQRTDNTASF